MIENDEAESLDSARLDKTAEDVDEGKNDDVGGGGVNDEEGRIIDDEDVGVGHSSSSLVAISTNDVELKTSLWK